MPPAAKRRIWSLRPRCHAARPPRRTTAQHFAKNAAGPRRRSAQPVFPSACFAVVLLPGASRFGPVTLRLARGRVDKPGLRRKCRSGHKALRLFFGLRPVLSPLLAASVLWAVTLRRLRDARLPSVSGWSLGRLAARRSPSLRSIRAAPRASALLISRRRPSGPYQA